MPGAAQDGGSVGGSDPPDVRPEYTTVIVTGPKYRLSDRLSDIDEAIRAGNMAAALPALTDLANERGGEFFDVVFHHAYRLEARGEVDSAIALVRAAVHGMEALPRYRCTVHGYLRVPRYFTRIGRLDDAWAELEHRLDWVRSVLPPPGRWFYESIVHNEMRLLLQRHGRPREAIEHGLLAHLLRAKGLHERERHDDLAKHRSHEKVVRAVKSMLRQSGDLDRLQVLVDALEDAERELAAVDHDAFLARVRAILAAGRAEVT